MTGPQWTALAVFVLLTTVGTAVLYGGVRRQGASATNSVLAALMAAAMFATLVALGTGATHRAVQIMSETTD